MPTFLIMSRHSPENCPMFNEKTRKTYFEYAAKLPEIMQKHGVKLIGSWTAPTEHFNLAIFEGPNSDVVNKVLMEPEVMALSAFETYEIKRVLGMEESAEFLQQAK